MDASETVSREPRLRGGDGSRLEGFSDAVMGFALTLLVLSLEVPETFEGLLDVLRGLPAFAVCFALLVWVWYLHHRFFRRYGLQDRITIFLNSALLFVVLVYVYPLKFLFVLFLGSITGIRPRSGVPGGYVMRFEEAPHLFVIYGSGFTAMFLMFALLHAHAWRRRHELQLDAVELMETRVEVARMSALAAIGLLSIGIALLAPLRHVAMAGWCYGLIGVVEFFVGLIRGQKRERLCGAVRPHVAAGAAP